VSTLVLLSPTLLAMAGDGIHLYDMTDASTKQISSLHEVVSLSFCKDSMSKLLIAAFDDRVVWISASGAVVHEQKLKVTKEGDSWRNAERLFLANDDRLVEIAWSSISAAFIHPITLVTLADPSKLEIL
jgi:hypothetical protein